jgi:hypothetical protein
MNAAIKALVKAQTEMGAVIKNAANPHLKSKYADLGSVLDACAAALHSNGFAIVQPCGKDDQGQFVETILAHESGEQLASRVYLVIGKNDMQGVGSAITYARRYGLLGMTGLAPEDDDGEATKAPRGQSKPPEPKADQKPQDKAPPSPAQIADKLIKRFGEMETLQALLDFTEPDTASGKAWDDLVKNHGKEADRVKAAFDKRKSELEG